MLPSPVIGGETYPIMTRAAIRIIRVWDHSVAPAESHIERGVTFTAEELCCRAHWLMGGHAPWLMGITPDARVHARRDARDCQGTGAA